MKKSLLIINRPLSRNDRGVLSVIEKLSKNSQVTILSVGPGDEVDGTLSKDICFGIKSRIVRKLIELDLFLLPSCFILFNIFRGGYSIVYTRELLFYHSILVARFFCKNTNFFLDIRENPNAKFPHYKYLLKQTASWFDKVITISPGLKSILEIEYKITAVELSYALPTKKFQNNIDLTKKVHKKDRLRVCFFGLVRPDRKLEIAVKALAMISDSRITLDIYGTVDSDDYFEYLRSIDTGDVCVFHGLVDYETAPKLLVEYDCGLLLNELNDNSLVTIPGKIWEYTSCGLCLISNDRPTISGFIRENKLGFIGDTPAEIAKVLLNLFENREILDQCKANSREFFSDISKKYSNNFITTPRKGKSK